MLVEFGNPNPKEAYSNGAPGVVYSHIPDEYGFAGNLTVAEVINHLWRNPAITKLGAENEAVLAVAHSAGIVANHTSNSEISWVWSDNEAFGAFLRELYGASERPDDVEDTHYTRYGPPGVGQAVGIARNVVDTITQYGRTMFSAQVFGGVVGQSGVSTTAPTATTYKLDGAGAPGSTTFYNNQRIFAGSTSVGSVWANIVSNTNVSSPVLTVDRWYNSATPGGAAATTPLAGPWVIADGAAPAWFMALTASTAITPTAGEPQYLLTGEITTGGGGLIRKIAALSYNSPMSPSPTLITTLTTVYTANGSDSLPVTIAQVGTFNSMVAPGVVGAPMFFHTALGTTATLSASGDQLTITDAVTLTP